MAETFDAAGRLAEGSPGVADFQQYVLACQCLGYQHPDLTAQPAQVHDSYATEDGMDLSALQTDCAALQAAAAAAEDALAHQDEQLDVLTTAWQGDGANASRDFLRRHGEASTVAATAVRAAAHALADLRDRLWRAVDDKVATGLNVGDSVQARRADWLAASQTVTTGAGDRAVASELVDHEVKPFVDNVIGGEWLAAMRAAVDAIEAAYEAVTAELAAQGEAAFDVPGELGPGWKPLPSVDGVAPTTAPAGTVVAAPVPSAPPVSPAPGAPGAWGPPPVAAPPAGVPAPAAAPLPTDPAMAQPTAAPSLPSLGGGLPDIGSGLSGFGQQLGDMLGGLLGERMLDDPMGVDDPPDSMDADGLDDEGDPDLDDSGEVDENDDEPDEAGGNEEKPEEPVDQAAETACPVPPVPAAAAESPVDEPAATPPPEPMAVTPEPPPDPPAEASGTGTPCEIAANELPQVGE